MNDNTKKFCFVLNHLSTGGTERVIINLSRVLTSYGHKVDIIILEDDVKQEIKNEKFVVHNIAVKLPCYLCYWLRAKLKPQGLNSLDKAAEKLRNKIKELGHFDAVISNTPDTDYLCIVAKISNLYCMIHCDAYNQFLARCRNYFRAWRKYYSWVRSFRKLYEGQNIITISNEMKQRIISCGVRPKSIRTIYNLFDFDLIRNKAKEYKVVRKNYILYAGRLCAQKNIPLLLTAYAKSNITHQLLMLGVNLDDKKIEKIIYKLKLKEKVTAIDFNPNPYPYIKHADALILSSNFEGLPTVLIEALILGTPVVSTSCPTGPKEILTGELERFLSPPKDMNALAKNIHKIIDNPPQITDKYINKFSKENIYSEWLKLKA